MKVLALLPVLFLSFAAHAEPAADENLKLRYQAAKSWEAEALPIGAYQNFGAVDFHLDGEGKAQNFRQVIQNESLSFEADSALNTLVIKDARTKRTWTADLTHCISDAVITKWGPLDQAKFDAFSITNIAQLDEHKIQIAVKEAQTGKARSMIVTLNGPNVSFEVSTENVGAPFAALGLPPMFTTDMKAGYLTFCDRSSGVLKKQDDTGVGYNETMLTVYGNTNCMNIPLIGLFDQVAGDAMMMQIESPLDANVRLSRKGGLIWPEPVWQCSMGKFAYPRRVTYRFIDKGGYVKMAELYREYQKERGMLKTLEEKARDRPMVKRMKGSPILWAEASDIEFLKRVRNFGITNAILASEFSHTENKKWSDLGYIPLGYDSYGDISEGPLGFQSDSIQENGHMLSTGEMLTGWTTKDPSGNVIKQYYLRSSSKYLNAAMAYSQSRISDANRNGNFIDVMMAMNLMEDYHPKHTYDRKTDLKYKREVFQYYLQKGLVIGTEHGNDWGVDLVDYTEGGLSGSNWWIPGTNTSGWNPGHLRAPVSREDFSPEYLKYGLPTQRIPFWELVYHDCVATTWYWGDSAGWFWKVAPEIKTMKDRITLLYGDMPLLWSEVKFDWKNDGAEHLETYYLTVPSMRDKFGVQMTSHEFLTNDLQVQRTTFANGSETVVNFGEKTFEYKGEKLPKNGFYCTGPNLQQRRVLRDGNIVTWVKTDQFFYCDSPSPIKELPLSISGKIVLFKMDDSQWNLVLTGATGESVELPDAALASYIGKTKYKVSGFDGEWNRTEPHTVEGKVATFRKKVYALTD